MTRFPSPQHPDTQRLIAAWVTALCILIGCCAVASEIERQDERAAVAQKGQE